MANDTQADQWNGANGRFWAEHSRRYDAVLRPRTRALMKAAAVGRADRVLDVGCGCGETTRLAASSASEGSALGVDLSAPMLEIARAAAAELPNARFEQADVQTRDFGTEEPYDLVLSRFGVMFFDAPETAFGNLAGALRPGGRIAFVCWQGEGGNDYFQVPFAALAPYVELPAPVAPNAPGGYSLADPDRVAALLTGAGFTEPRLESLTEPLRIGDDAVDVVSFLRRRPVFRELLDPLDDETAARATDALTAAHRPYETADGVLMNAPSWLVTAARP
ncbi:methyltransferase domain-containing protein [Streptomyces sp. NPDC051940]|uniref:class I SAM-dependent methyltransferase n=1 Tax=Streptomyces sp. NPDC051940 TaxID=3155675 RepID=UPI00342DC3E9